MAVAKSYEKMEIIGEPYSYDKDPKKLYIKVKGPCHRCGGSGNYSYNPMDGTRCLACRGCGYEVKEVRWYTDKQREALDRAAEKRAAAKAVKQEERRVKFAARNAFGFGEAGFITIFQGDQKVLNEWAHETDPCRARYNTLFGWFCPSTLPIENLPESVKPMRLEWDMVRNPEDEENLTMREDEYVISLVNFLTSVPSKSTYQGEIGNWIQKDVTVTKNIAVDSRYGDSHMHILEDADENVYVWTTASKNYSEGIELHLKMKVKDYKEYKGVKQTIVYYCKEV